MSAEATVHGTVVGEPGRPVAGWVSLGPNQPQRWIAYDVRIKTDAGQEVTLEGLTAGTIEPVVREKGPWREIEKHELAKLCLAEAPAPDVEVVLTTSVLRGGDPIIAWGTIIADDGGDDAKAPYRTTSEAGIHRLAVLAVGRGEDPDYALNQARARYEDAQREKEYVRAKRATEQGEKPAPVPTQYPTAPKSSSNLPLTIGLAVAVLAGAAYLVATFVL